MSPTAEARAPRAPQCQHGPSMTPSGGRTAPPSTTPAHDGVALGQRETPRCAARPPTSAPRARGRGRRRTVETRLPGEGETPASLRKAASPRPAPRHAPPGGHVPSSLRGPGFALYETLGQTHRSGPSGPASPGRPERRERCVHSGSAAGPASCQQPGAFRKLLSYLAFNPCAAPALTPHPTRPGACAGSGPHRRRRVSSGTKSQWTTPRHPAAPMRLLTGHATSPTPRSSLPSRSRGCSSAGPRRQTASLMLLRPEGWPEAEAAEPLGTHGAIHSDSHGGSRPRLPCPGDWRRGPPGQGSSASAVPSSKHVAAGPGPRPPGPRPPSLGFRQPEGPPDTAKRLLGPMIQPVTILNGRMF